MTEGGYRELFVHGRALWIGVFDASESYGIWDHAYSSALCASPNLRFHDWFRKDVCFKVYGGIVRFKYNKFLTTQAHTSVSISQETDYPLRGQPPATLPDPLHQTLPVSFHPTQVRLQHCVHNAACACRHDRVDACVRALLHYVL